MTAAQALLTLFLLILAGGIIIVLVRRIGNKKKSPDLPTDPLCDIFINEDDKI